MPFELHQVVAAAGALLDPARMAQLAVDEVRRVLPADVAVLHWWDGAEQLLVPLAWAGDEEEIQPQLHPGQGLTGTVYATARERVANDPRTELDDPIEWYEATTVGAAVPLLADGAVIGVLSARRHAGPPFGPEALETLRPIATQLGPALHNVRLLAEAQRRTLQARSLAELMRRGGEAGDPAVVHRMIASYACRLLGADVAGVAVPDDGQSVVWGGAYGTRSEAWRTLRYPRDSFAAREVMRSAGPVLSSRDGDAVRIRPDNLPFYASEGVVTGLSVPLSVREDLVGALALGWRSERTVIAQHVELASALAAFAGVLADQARAGRRLRTVVNSAPVALLATDEEGFITLAEGRALEDLGLGRDLVGRRADAVLPESPALVDRIQRAREAGTERLEVPFGGRTFDAHVIGRAEGGYVVATDVTARRRLQDDLLHQATHDGLTGLPNRRLVLERVAARLQEEDVALALVDLRDFDAVNDSVGHDAGDDLLRLLGDRLREALPDALVLGRTGGDEFATACPGAAAAGDALADRLVAALEQPVVVAGQTIGVRARCGVAAATRGERADVLLNRADAALQTARRGQGTRVRWDAAMARRRTGTIRLVQDLRRAVAADELHLAFQPIVDLATGAPRRVEALLRWRHPTQGDIPPGDFIEAAERSGAIELLTPWVVDHALAACRRWRDRGVLVPVSVNVSGEDLRPGRLAEPTTAALARHGLPPAALCVEVTEHALVEEAGAVEELHALAALGLGIGIDDFGTGWSSLAYLKRLPATQLKVDRSFVATMAESPLDAAIVRAVLDLAAAFDLEVVAEGVEDERTTAALLAAGCRMAQGYHFARPMEAEGLLAWLSGSSRSDQPDPGPAPGDR